MLPISSGTTTERIVRTMLVTGLINAFAVWYLWDGYVGYARDNAQKLIDHFPSLGLDDDGLPPINPMLTAAEGKRLEKGADADALTAILGDPTLEDGDDTYYLGSGGYLRVRWEGERSPSIKWRDEGFHSDTDQALQRGIGWALGVVGVALFINFVRVVTTRVSLTEAGLKLRGRPCIPFASMRALRADKPGVSGCVELDYSIDGREGSVRLDSYVVKEYSAIVAAICERTGLPRP